MAHVRQERTFGPVGRLGCLCCLGKPLHQLLAQSNLPPAAIIKWRSANLDGCQGNIHIKIGTVPANAVPVKALAPSLMECIHNFCGYFVTSVPIILKFRGNIARGQANKFFLGQSDQVQSRLIAFDKTVFLHQYYGVQGVLEKPSESFLAFLQNSLGQFSRINVGVRPNHP